MPTEPQQGKLPTPKEPKPLKKLNNASVIDLEALKLHLKQTGQTSSLRYRQVEKVIRAKLLFK